MDSGQNLVGMELSGEPQSIFVVYSTFNPINFCMFNFLKLFFFFTIIFYFLLHLTIFYVFI